MCVCACVCVRVCVYVCVHVCVCMRVCVRRNLQQNTIIHIYHTGGNFQEMKFLRKASKQKFCTYLLATLINDTEHNLTYIRGSTNIQDYIFT